MTTLMRSSGLVTNTLALWLTVLAVAWGGFWAGSASAQEATAREDSLAQAFFLLKLDFEIEKARSAARDTAHAMIVDGLEDRYEWQVGVMEESFRRQWKTMLVSSVVAVMLLMAGVLLQ